ncbi:acetate/propionate family kinase [Pseudooceanicola sp.]|uniref:acetate/propionate family kinase n=1 Tax=Pseudooceanicola sp. TaxID=1914328 RepID=UPI00260DA291|nr:acetate/propionate family kinase [Pseudooceanicola sp.]MDF1855027.1 acetate/propionate family kinase [Pseudooceanicola sp.]
MAHVLVLNAGSSSLKFGLFSNAPEPQALASGQVERIGSTPRLKLKDAAGETLAAAELDTAGQDHAAALIAVLGALETHFPGARIGAVGHRVVHGGLKFTAPVALTPEVIARLETLIPFAPLHQPHNLAGVRAAIAAFPEARQIACFDTAFHRNHPFVNDTFALPRAFYDKGVRRYGFHGLSYEYIAGHLAATAPDLFAGRVVVAHLGNGASMCGMKAGRSIASSMGFTALDGLPMGTRSGQIDPGVVLYLIEQEGLSPAEVTEMLYKRSGLLGLSGISHDMRQLLASDDPAARQAIEYFTFRIRRELGGLAAALGGLDALVFTGGIGENAAPIRAEVCAGMDWIGITLDAAANAGGANQSRARRISTGDSPVQVLVLPTNEELVIARATAS